MCGHQSQNNWYINGTVPMDKNTNLPIYPFKVPNYPSITLTLSSSPLERDSLAFSKIPRKRKILEFTEYISSRDYTRKLSSNYSISKSQ